MLLKSPTSCLVPPLFLIFRFYVVVPTLQVSITYPTNAQRRIDESTISMVDVLIPFLIILGSIQWVVPVVLVSFSATIVSYILNLKRILSCRRKGQDVTKQYP